MSAPFTNMPDVEIYYSIVLIDLNHIYKVEKAVYCTGRVSGQF